MRLSITKGLFSLSLVGLCLFWRWGAEAETILNFDSTVPNQASNAPIAQSFGDNIGASTNGITVVGFGTPNLGLVWQGGDGDATRWNYHLDPVWSAAQLNECIVGSAYEIIFRPDNPTVSVVIKSFRFHPYFLSSERFTFDVAVLSGTNFLKGPIPIAFDSDASKNHLVSVDSSGLPGQTLTLRLTRVPSVLTGTEVEGDPEHIAVDDITFAQLPELALPAGLGPLQISSSLRADTNLFIEWVNGTPPFQVQFKNNLSDLAWTSFGSATSNRHANIPIQPGTGFIRVAAQEDPDYGLPMGLETWYSTPDQGSYNASDVTNIVNQHFANGMPQLGYRYYILDDFWQGGRTNGHLAPNSRFAFALTNGYLAAHLHSKGVKLVLYTENVAVTSAGNTGSGGYTFPTTNSHGEFPVPAHDYYKEDTADFAAWGVDGVKFDPHAISDWNQGLYEVHQFSSAWRNATLKPLWLLVDIVVYNWLTGIMTVTNFNPCEMFSEVNALRLTTDTAFPGVTNEWHFEESIFTAVERWGQCACPGHLMYLEHAGFVGQSNAEYFELGKGTTAMRAMLHSPMFTGSWDIAGDPDRWFGLTNLNILRIAHDANYKPATRVISNSVYHAWSKPLADGTRAVTLWNALGAATNCTIWWTNLGFAPEQPCAVFNCWSNRLETITTGSFTAPVTNTSAETFFIYPTNAP